ncbi:hypothetical protein JN535_04725 [Cellulosimicrobium cellulans]|uniref:hypothetical protein n=1 Tax=Cellulosimicrobium cellulans TaxID=1710 RepID=UPI00196622E1|nr:hypothetical protein [Cellulosimicrobium cellulans]MBN0039479.1 hypothetical protein [Cellulosimicrobium cellulans]
MGTDNVRLTFAVWGDLPHLPFRVLTFMALCSLDQPTGGKPARVYYGGREHLSAAVRHEPLPAEPEDPTSPEGAAAEKERRATFQTLKRALAELKRAGAIDESKSRRGTYRSTAEYVLSFDRTQGVTERTPTAQSATSVDATRGTEAVPLQGVAERTPQGYGERTRRGTPGVPPTTSTSTHFEEPLQHPLPEAPHQRAANGGVDKEYEAASQVLVAYGPRSHALIEQIRDASPATSVRDAAVEAARIIRAVETVEATKKAKARPRPSSDKRRLPSGGALGQPGVPTSGGYCGTCQKFGHTPDTCTAERRTA